MGGAISSIGGAISGVVKSVESGIGNAVMSVAKTVESGAVNLLQDVVDSGIKGAGSALAGAVGNIPLVGGLLSSLINKGTEGLTGLANSGISSLGNSLLNGLGNILNVGGQNVTTPSIADRAASAPQSTQSLQQMMQTVLAQLQGVKTAAGAATAAPAASTAASAATAATTGAGAVSNGGDLASSLVSQAKGLRAPKLSDYKSPPDQADLMDMQQKLSDYNNTMTALSSMMSMLENLNKSIIGNFPSR